MMIRTVAVILSMVVTLAACAEKPFPHKLEGQNSGSNSPPTSGSW